MKLKHLILSSWLILVPSLAAADAGVPTPGPAPKISNDIYVNLGFANPYSPSVFTNAWTVGSNFGFGYGFGITRKFSIVLDLHANSFPMNSANFPGVTGGTLHSTQVLANAKYIFVNAANPVLLYGIAGLGFDSYSQDAFSQMGGDNFPGVGETDLAFRVGLGFDIMLDQGFALTIESNVVASSASQTLDSAAATTQGLFSLGLKFDN